MMLGAMVPWGDLTSWAAAWIFLGWIFGFTWHLLAFGMLAVFAYCKEFILR